MRLAENEITIKVGKVSYRLSPTLRAASRLHSRFGIEKLHRNIMEGKIVSIAALIAETSIDQPSNELEISYVLADNLRNLESLVEPLTKLIAAFFGSEAKGKASSKPVKAAKNAKPVDIEEILTKLYRTATGYLGWPPKQAWESTPAEIMEAFEGRKELYGEALSVITHVFFGSNSASPEHNLDSELDEEGLHALKGLGSL